MFTVPPGGDGLYYFSTYLLIDDGDLAYFNLVVNDDDILCTAYGDHDSAGEDYSQAACSAMAQLNEGSFFVHSNSLKAWHSSFQVIRKW